MSSVTAAHSAPADPDAQRRTDIQGLRALAILLVVIYHADLPLPGGFAGVDVFFVISGYVISRLLLRELALTGRVALGAFYARRVMRLLPALALMSVSVALLAVLLNPVGTQLSTAWTGIGASLFSANAYLYRSAPGYFSPGAEFNTLLHTWSLAVEEQFYFVFPLCIALAWRGLSNRRAANGVVWLGIGCALAMIASFGISLAMSHGSSAGLPLGAPAQFAFYAPLTRAWEFLAGVVLALTPGWQARMGPAARGLAALVGLLLLAGGAFWIDGRMRFPGWVALVPVTGTALLIAAGSAGRHWASGALQARGMVWLGDRSYGWYLWHWPAVVFARAALPDSPAALVVASALSLIPAWASWRFVETPLRTWRPRPTGRQAVTLALACVSMPVLACAVLIQAHHAMVDRGPASAVGAGLQLHADTVRGCEDAKPLQEAGQAGCTWEVPQARGTVALVGDSNAGHLTEAVVEAAGRAQLNAVVATVPACPYVDLDSFSHGVPNTRCANFVQASLTALERLRPALIIVSLASDGYIEADSTTLAPRAGGPLARTPDEKAALWTTGMTRLLSRLERIAPVVLVQPVPRFHTWALARCAAWRAIWLPSDCAQTVSLQTALLWRERAAHAQALAVAALPHVRLLDLAGDLCPQGQCAVRQESVWMFRDGAHLSVPGARQMSGAVGRALSASLRAPSQAANAHARTPGPV